MTTSGSLDEFLHDMEPFFYGKSLTYVDAGAFVGKVFKKVMASGLKVREAHLIEPNPASLSTLREVVSSKAADCALSVYPFALGAEAGTARLRAAQSMTRVTQSASGEGPLEPGQDGVFDVECRTLDELAVGFTDGHVSLLKLDVEGSEVRVLAGAVALLRDQRVDVIYVEAGMNPEGTQQCYYRDIDDCLRQHGYRLFRVYEQMHEWLEDSPVLRRVNLAYLSQKFANQHPFRLSRDLFEARKQLKLAQAENASEKARTAAAVAAADAERARCTSANDDAERLSLRVAELELELRLSGSEREQLARRLEATASEHERDLRAAVRDRVRLEAIVADREELLVERTRLRDERARAEVLSTRLQSELELVVEAERGVRAELAREQAMREALLRDRDELDAQLRVSQSLIDEARRSAHTAVTERDDATRALSEEQRAHRELLATLERESTQRSDEAELSRELASVRSALDAAGAERDSLLRQLDALRGKHVETEQMAREVHKLYEALRARERRARGEAAVANDKAARTRQHLSYRLGAALIENSRSPLGWVKTPGALRRAYGDFLQQKAERRPVAAPPPKDALRLGGAAVAVSMTPEWQEIGIMVEGAGELWAHPLSVVGGSLASLEMLVGSRSADARAYDLLGETLAVTSESAHTQARALKLRAARSALLLRYSGQGSLFVRLRKTRGEPCILRLEVRPLNVVGVPAPTGSVPRPQVPSALERRATAFTTAVVRPAAKTSAGAQNVLFEAFKLVRQGRGQAGLDFALAHADDAERGAISLVRALLVEGDEAAWLEHINDYLRPFGIAPLELAADGASRFHRLRARTVRHVNEGPLVSVIMPAFNAETTLAHAASSILAQTWRRLELIIVDDASNDATWSIAQGLAARDARVIALRNAANVGPYVSKNIALRRAKGDYVTGHDADDWAHPERIESHLAAANRTGTILRASLAGMLRMSEAGELTRFAPRGPNTNDGALVAGFISCLFDANFLKQVLGGWDEVRFAGDSEIIQRTEKVLGGGVPRFAHLGMICLDSPQGLTNHPELGYSPLLGMSPSRREYRDSFKRWHDTLGVTTAHLPFPQRKRFFDVPAALAVDPGALRATLDVHTRSGVLRDLEECDVCIVTDLRLSGGNASSTLDEARYLRAQGLKVLIVHCPSVRTQGKPVSDRYAEVAELCRPFHDVTAIRTDVLIVRHPAVAASAKFGLLLPRIEARATAIIVNNSLERSDGSAVYSVDQLLENVAALRSERVRVYPLGPAIRRELSGQGTRLAEHLAEHDWTPTFDARKLAFEPKEVMSSPFVIGRHARDGAEKWLERRERLSAAYPDTPEFSVSILGGADAALAILGERPSNWEILPFGSIEPAAYLAKLDAFVYFPHSGLNEAFGRAVMEAIFAGIPCVLPRSFRTTFEDMAFYSEPEDVAGVVRRLSRYPEWRLDFLKHARERARRYESGVLAERLSDLSGSLPGDGKSAAPPCSLPVLKGPVREYKTWVETGQWATTSIVLAGEH
jgi:FkbM family methyltransferase